MMASRTARTIDGMRPAGEPTRRVVGFDGMKTNSFLRTSSNLRAQKAASQRNTRRNDFGLSNGAAEKARAKANSEFIKPVSTLEFDLSSKDLRPDYSLKKRDMAEAPVRHGKKMKPHKKGGKIKKILIAILVIGVLGGGAFAIWGNNLISKLTGGQSGLFELIGAISSNVKLKTDENGRTNILIFGTSGYAMDGSMGDGSEHDGAQLTDSIMLLSIDQETKDVAMVSLPRDLYVGNTCTATGKVNEVYFCANLYGNDEESGAKALENTVSEIFDVDIQYHVHLDWAALVQIVDSLGGVTVTLDEDIEDGWTETFIKAGEPVTLNGERALGLARARHGTTMGDFTRGNSQQKILAGIQRKIVEDGLDLGTGLSLIEAVGDNVRMNFTLEEVKSVFALAKDISFDSMRQIPLIDYEKGIYYLSTADMNGISYVVPAAGVRNYTDIQKYVHKMMSSNPAVREDATILVLNGSGEVGVAAAEQSKLEADGFTNVEIGDAPAGEYVENYYIYDASGETPGTLEIMKERYKVEALAKEQLPNGINTKNVDIVIIIGKPAESSAAVNATAAE